MKKSFFKSKPVNYLMTAVFVLICPAFAVFFANYVIRGGLMPTIDYMLNKLPQARIGYMPMLFLTMIITFTVRKVSVAYLLIGGISIIGGSAYYFKMLYRGEVLWPTDIVFLDAAGSMLKEFNISLTAEMKEALFALVVAVVISHIFTMPKIKGRYILNVIMAGAAAVLLFANAKLCFLNPDFYSKIESFAYISNPTNIYHRNTFHSAFLFYINNAVVTRPDNYSKETVNRLLDNNDNKAQQTTPDVILILLESYFDPNSLFGLEFTDSINENYNSIAQKAVYGNMLSFKYGGGTADIEFNILNQLNTTYFTEALSYMNIYGNRKLPSFVQDLKAADYSTYAMHAYTSQLYNRIKAYKNMGFDGSKFIDTYSNTGTYGSYISDISHVEEMIEKYEEYVATGAENIFLYGVSMQNHMYMSQDNLTDRVYLKDKGYSRSFTDGMGILASYMRQTDMAIKRLYDYFEQVDREVVIILYGDHQSYNIDGLSDFSTASLKEISAYSSMTDKEKYIASHTTPFIIWSNQKDMGGEYWPLISPHNLWALASQSYGLPSGEYEQYLYEQMQTMPVDNEYAGIWCDRHGNIYDEKPVQISDNIMMLNYDRLFGKQYSLANQ